MPQKLGLVLAGGGGKGAYQIGVWKYLREIGIDSRIAVVSGTSVGGLNGFLIANGDFDVAVQIWTKEIATEILDVVSTSYKKGALFSRQGLLDIIERHIDFSTVKSFDKTLYVTCTNINSSKAEYIKLNGLSKSKIEKYLLATSAIPGIFENERIKMRSYCDGGLYDNVPIKPLIEENCTHAIIVNLNSNSQRSFSEYGIKSVVIKPSSSLGNFLTGTLNFLPVNAKAGIEMGYNDCRKLYASMLEKLL